MNLTIVFHLICKKYHGIKMKLIAQLNELRDVAIIVIKKPFKNQIKLRPSHEDRSQ